MQVCGSSNHDDPDHVQIEAVGKGNVSEYLHLRAKERGKENFDAPVSITTVKWISLSTLRIVLLLHSWTLL